MKRFIWLLLFAFFMAPQAYPLAVQQIQFADDSTFNVSETTAWFEIKHFHYIDFTVVASAGDGTMTVEYASDAAGLSAVEDATTAAFDTTEAATLTGAGLAKFYVRLRLDCVTAPCTYSGWFTAKGQMP